VSITLQLNHANFSEITPPKHGPQKQDLKNRIPKTGSPKQDPKIRTSPKIETSRKQPSFLPLSGYEVREMITPKITTLIRKERSRFFLFLYPLSFFSKIKTDPLTTIQNRDFITELNMNFSLLSESGLSLMDFAAQRDYYTLKRKQIMIAREVENTERHIHRKGEDEKYSIFLANRRREDELRRTKREAEDNELRDIEKMTEDKELVSYQKMQSTELMIKARCYISISRDQGDRHCPVIHINQSISQQAHRAV
jgi:hypothetical protein